MTFMTDIVGDVVGDLLINPDNIPSNSPADSLPTSVNVNLDANAQINNDITLNAQSGDASVTKNTTAGDATTGDAHAIANLVNLMNTAIAANQSFLGVLNIHGSLDGDILLPPGFLDSLLAANAPRTQLNESVENLEVLAQFKDSQTIANSVSQNATSGNATVTGNTTAGGATSGDALNNLTILNLTGRQVIGSNALLVFVNVLGDWVGLILDAPAGSTTAALGGGINNNTALLPTVGADTDISATSNSEINNNLTLSAQSGDATVQSNTTAGGAHTGDASTSANIANLIGNQFSLSDWFGILFINVFGSWRGSFGLNTSAGDRTAPAPAPSSGTTSVAGSASQQLPVFRFVPGGTPNKMRIIPISPATSTTSNQQTNLDLRATAIEPLEEADTGFVLSTATSAPTSSGANPDNTKGVPLVPILGLLTGALLLVAERAITLRQRRHHTA